jgi:hypothetical protein
MVLRQRDTNQPPDTPIACGVTQTNLCAKGIADHGNPVRPDLFPAQQKSKRSGHVVHIDSGASCAIARRMARSSSAEHAASFCSTTSQKVFRDILSVCTISLLWWPQCIMPLSKSNYFP